MLFISENKNTRFLYNCKLFIHTKLLIKNNNMSFYQQYNTCCVTDALTSELHNLTSVYLSKLIIHFRFIYK